LLNVSGLERLLDVRVSRSPSHRNLSGYSAIGKTASQAEYGFTDIVDACIFGIGFAESLPRPVAAKK
jgi:hypothetical protein